MKSATSSDRNSPATRFATFLALLGVAVFTMAGAVRSAEGAPQYLVFQLTTHIANPRGEIQPFDERALRGDIGAIVSALDGNRGDGVRTQLGFAVGPITLDHPDDTIRNVIRRSFAVAQDLGVAVAFHLDLSMFWKARTDLVTRPGNAEWLDWKRTPNRARKIDWGEPMRLAPQMCYNSPDIVRESTRLARDVIGAEIERGIRTLRDAGRDELFAGVIAGWETQLGRDFDTDRPSGYCALSNRGFSESRPPQDADAERESVVKEYIERWTGEFVRLGLPREKLYSHVSFIPKTRFAAWQGNDSRRRAMSYSEAMNFATPSVAFGEHHNPGFSTYPAPGLFDQLYAELAARGNPPWASSEGTNLVIGGKDGDSGMTMEGYLAKLFNHGATMVNIFAWGVGGQANRTNPFRMATESSSALAAYKKFLRGQPLIEPAVVMAVSADMVSEKVQKIHADLPAWISGGGDQSAVGPLMERLQRSMNSGDWRDADTVATEVLSLIGAEPGASRSTIRRRASTLDPEKVAQKVKLIQSKLPHWLRSGGDESRAAPLLEDLQQAMQRGDLREADRSATTLLQLLEKPN